MDAVQQKINDLHMKQLDETRKLALECNVKKNAAFAERTKALKEKGPKDFWFKVFSAHPDFKSELMGEYDDQIFRSLENFEVTMNPDGVTITMTFGPNDYFSNTTLTYQEIEQPGQEIVLKTSGVNWKPGKGPLVEEQQKPAEKSSNPWVLPSSTTSDNNNKESGQRREREEEGRGISFFSFFETVPPMPEKPAASGAATGADGAAQDDDYFDDEGFGDNESYLSDLDAYDEMIDERREIARCICDEIWDNPAEYIKKE